MLNKEKPARLFSILTKYNKLSLRTIRLSGGTLSHFQFFSEFLFPRPTRYIAARTVNKTLLYDQIYEFAKTHPKGLSIMLMMETGISRSELLELKWSDVDLEHCVFHIRQGLVSYQDVDTNAWVAEESSLKNDYRRRDVPLVDQDPLHLLRTKLRCIEVSGNNEAGPKIIRPEFVFHSPEGHPCQPNNWRNRGYIPFVQDLQKTHSELPELSPHELRHTRATLWLAQRISLLMVAKLLGHSDVKCWQKYLTTQRLTLYETPS